MNAAQLERLVWEQIDGTLSTEDRTRLEAFLASHPEAEAVRRQIVATADLLGAVAPVPPPPALPDDIARLLAARPAPRARRAFWRELGHEVLAPRWRARLAWATVGVCAGVALTVLLVADFGRSGEGDVSRFYGAMHVQPQGLAIELPESLGRVVLQRRGTSLIVAVSAERQPAQALTLDLEGPGMALGTYRADTRAASAVTVRPDRVTVLTNGSGDLLLELLAPPSRVALRLRLGQAVVFERDIGLDQVPSG